MALTLSYIMTNDLTLVNPLTRYTVISKFIIIIHAQCTREMIGKYRLKRGDFECV